MNSTKRSAKQTSKATKKPTKEDPPSDNDPMDATTKKPQKEKNRKASASSTSGSTFQTVDLSQRIIKEDTNNSKRRVKFQGIKDESADNQVCHGCYQIVKFPEEDKSEDESMVDVDQAAQQKAEQDAKYLYSLVYCQDCSVAVHWCCIGEHKSVLEFKKGTETYYVFQCDRCKYKEKNVGAKAPKCLACYKDEGFLKQIKKGEKSKDKEEPFVHLICSLMFPEYLYIVQGNQMMIKTSMEYERFKEQQAANKQQLKKGGCVQCNSSQGFLLKCQHEKCHHQIHAYCMMDYLKKYYYDSSREDYKGNIEEDYKDKWNFQIFYNEETMVPEPYILCHEHQEGKIKFCSCRSMDASNQNMIMCESCYLWYHDNCEDVDRQDYQNTSYICKKCLQWKEHLTTTVIDVILRKKEFRLLVDSELSTWSFGSILIPNDRVMIIESKLFEQVMYMKLYIELQQLLIRNTCHIQLVKSLISDADRLFIRPSYFARDLDRQKKQSEDLIKDSQKDKQMYDGDDTLKDIVDENFNFIPENQKFNEEYTAKCYGTIQHIIEKAKLITPDVDFEFRIKKSNDLMNKVYREMAQPGKLELAKVVEYQEELSSYDLNGYNMYKYLTKIVEDHYEWQNTLEKQLLKGVVSDEDNDKKLSDIKLHRGLMKVDERYQYFKEYYLQKCSTTDYDRMVEEGNKLKTIVEDDLQAIKANLEVAQKWEKVAIKVQNQKEGPVKKMYQHLRIGMLGEFRSDQALDILEKWNGSAIWHEKAKSFIIDKREDKVKMTDEPDQQFTYTLDQAKDLVNQKDHNDIEIYKDQALLKKAKEKVKRIQTLKGKYKSYLEDQNDLSKLNDYRKEMALIENVDFTKEINEIKEKIKLVKQTQNAIDGKKESTTLETLEQLNNRVTAQPNAGNQEPQIKLPWEMIMMLQTKLQTARDLKLEFQDILKQNENTFTKQMVADLKRIIQQAKDHHIEMKEESVLVGNLQFSEDWFFTTFEKLKSVTGKGLHQVDFKDYIQLATVIQNEKDCDQLVKCAKHENLVGAAKNLFFSLAGVKWLFEVKKVLQGQKRELVKISNLDSRAKELKLNMEPQEVGMSQQTKDALKEFKEVSQAVSRYQELMGTQSKIIKTLREYQDKLKELKVESDELKLQLQEFNVVTQGEQLEVFTKMHSYIDFTLKYQEHLSNSNKITHQKAMLLQEEATAKHIPHEIPILEQLNKSVARFDKFRRNYKDYQAFRERMKKQGANLTQSVGDSKFTCQFIRKLIAQSKALDIEISSDYFDQEALEQDLQLYDQWKVQAELVLGQLEDSEAAINSKDLRERFTQLKQKMKTLPVYDKETFKKISLFDWLFQCVNMLEVVDQSQYKTLAHWEGFLEEGEEQYAQFFSNFKNHSIYQRLIWEIESAKTVQDFVNTQKNTSKSMAAKYNQGNAQNYAMFRGKQPKRKVEEALQKAKECKIDVFDEIRTLERWLTNYNMIQEMTEQGSLLENHPYDKLKEFSKMMYLSPIDYGELFYDLKNKLDIAESIRLDIKRIFQEYQGQVMVAKIKEKGRARRMKFSRLSYDLKQFHKECKIKGIKEVEEAIERVQKCRDKLKVAKSYLDQIALPEGNSNIADLLDKAKQTFQEVEYDMEGEETDVRRGIFEQELIMLFEQKTKRKLQLEEFKALEKEYNHLKNYLKDEELHAKFIEHRDSIHELVRKINKVESKADLKELETQAETQFKFLDFTQLLTDKDVEFQLGKRKTRGEEVEEPEMDLAIDIKRKKKVESASESSSESSKSGSSSSSSGSGSGSSSSSSGSGESSSEEEGSSEGEEESESSEEEKVEGMAQNRSRRKIVAKYQEDFIYEQPVLPKSAFNPPKPMTEEEKRVEKKRLKDLKKQKKRERKRREKERQKRQQREIEAHAAAQKAKKTQLLKQTFNKDEPPSLATQLTLDQGLQQSLQAMKTKIREQSRIKIKDLLETNDLPFIKLPKDQLRQIIIDLETDVYNSHPEVDQQYRKKIGDITENVKFLKDYKTVADQFAAKTLQVTKMTLPHPNFKDMTLKINAKSKEKRQALRHQQFKEDQKFAQAKTQQQQQYEKLDPEVEIHKDQRMMQAFYPSTNTSQNVTPQAKHPVVKTLDEDSDDLLSMGGGDANFSDSEYNSKPPAQHQTTGGNEYDPYQPMQTSMYGGALQITGVTDFTGMYIPPRIVPYNPYETLDRYTRLGQKKSSEPILYDPNKNKLRQQREKNVAPSGSLLKVWDGNLELLKGDTLGCLFYSTYDISVFQSLPDMPQVVTLKGKAKTQDVMSHFLRLRKDKKVFRGWVVRKNPHIQENNERYEKMYDELVEQEKSILFNVFQGVTLYMVPIGPTTKDFVKQMGIEVLQLNESEKQGMIDVDQVEQQESKQFAFLSQIKQTFNVKGQCWNPEVIRIRERTEEETKGGDGGLSPITSDEENPVQEHAKLVRPQQQGVPPISVKKEGQDYIQGVKTQQQPDQYTYKQEQFGQQQDPRQVENQQDYAQMEDEDDIDIDSLIQRFKSQELDLQSIQAELLPIISRVTGEKERKLTEFLQELIQKYRNQGVKQEPQMVQQPPSNMLQGQGYNQGQMPQQPSMMGYQQQQAHQQFGQQPQRYQQPAPQQYSSVVNQQLQPPYVPLQSQYMYGAPQGQQMNQPYQVGGIRPPPQQMGGIPPQQQMYNQQYPSQFQQRPPQQSSMMPQQQQQFQQRPNYPLQGMPPQQQQFPGQPPLRQPMPNPQMMPGQQQQLRRPPVPGQQQPNQYGGQYPYYGGNNPPANK